MSFVLADVVLNRIHANLSSVFGSDTALSHMADACGSCLLAGFAVFADAAVAALYVSLRDAEKREALPGTLTAFD